MTDENMEDALPSLSIQQQSNKIGAFSHNKILVTKHLDTNYDIIRIGPGWIIMFLLPLVVAITTAKIL